MSRSQSRSLVRHLRRVVGPKGTGMPDADLLRKFVNGGDESAFELLVWRHERMVLGVCQRVLQDEHGAEDAFQATFLTLVRKASSITKQRSVAGWLYKVAYRIALTARSKAARRTRHEREAGFRLAARADVNPFDNIAWRELQPVLDEELSRLPEKWRVPFVLCYLEGKSYEETAKELVWPKGTVAAMIARARERLRGRLARRGVTLSATVFAGALSQSAQAAAVPYTLVSSTLESATLLLIGKAGGAISLPVLTLMEGAVNAMFWTKFKLAAGMLLAVGALSAGAGVTAHRTLAEEKSALPQTERREKPKPAAAERAPPPKAPVGKAKISISGQVVDPNGKPVEGAKLLYHHYEFTPGFKEATATSHKDGKFTFDGLTPALSYELVVSHRQRKLGAVTTISHSDRLPRVTIKLEPTGVVTGRVLNKEKQPLAKAGMTLSRVAPAGVSTAVESVTTDGDGRFRFQNLVPGLQHALTVYPEGYAGSSYSRFTIQAGETKQLEDKLLTKADQSIAGIVVDPTGKPVPGANVMVSPEQGEGGVSMRLGEDGKFRVPNLPAGKIQIQAFTTLNGHPGNTTAFARMRVQAGKQDIRIVLTPPSDNRGEAAVGKPAPEFPVFKWLNAGTRADSKSLQRADFADKVIVLAFLDEAKPSKRLLPQLDQLQQKLADKGLIVVRIYETETAGELAKASPTTAALVKPGLMAGGYGEAFQKYGVRATPMLFLVDRAGVVRHVDLQADDLERLVAELFAN